MMDRYYDSLKQPNYNEEFNWCKLDKQIIIKTYIREKQVLLEKNTL